MFMAVFTIARMWKQPNCPSVDEIVNTDTHIHLHACTYAEWNTAQP